MVILIFCFLVRLADNTVKLSKQPAKKNIGGGSILTQKFAHRASAN